MTKRAGNDDTLSHDDTAAADYHPAITATFTGFAVAIGQNANSAQWRPLLTFHPGEGVR